jgi:cytochrome c-type biogenesis protein CcmH/NrfG
MKHLTLLILGLLTTASLYAQRPITEGIGSYVKSPEEKAMELYGRGMRAKRKAEGEKDPEKQAKLYLKAKEDISKAMGYAASYDGFLALGQVYLALGQSGSGLDACTRSLSLKPGNAEAQSCVETAKAKMKEEARTAQGSGQR